MKYQILNIEDHEVVSLGLQSILAGSDFEVCKCVVNANDAIEFLDNNKTDLVLLDVRLEKDDGLVLLSKIRARYANLPVVMFTMFNNPTYIARAIAGGAADYVLKSDPRDVLLDSLDRAVRRVEPSENSRLAKLRTVLLSHAEIPNGDLKTPLTKREIQVLRHIALGLSNKEVALALNISGETIKEHVFNIRSKIGVADRTAAAVWAVRNGLKG